eukprot:1333925-Amphidinium_carterae.3
MASHDGHGLGSISSGMRMQHQVSHRPNKDLTAHVNHSSAVTDCTKHDLLRGTSAKQRPYFRHRPRNYLGCP